MSGGRNGTFMRGTSSLALSVLGFYPDPVLVCTLHSGFAPWMCHPCSHMAYGPRKVLCLVKGPDVTVLKFLMIFFFKQRA